MPAVLTFTFDPVLRLSDTTSVRWETVGLAIVLFIGLVLAARMASLTSASPARAGEPSDDGLGIAPVEEPGLRIDDLVFMVVGAVPGAIVGGRLGYVLGHLDYYRANPAHIVDPAQGGLSLTLAVPLGILTGAVVARLLGAPIGRWMHALALPLLFVLGAGKVVGILGASGQGLPTDLEWATAYVGPGPWGSLAPELPSHPSPIYEAILVGLAIGALGLLSRSPALRRQSGASLFAALGLWAVARFVVATTWRDPVVVGPFRVEQLLLFGVLIVSALGVLLRARAAPPVIEVPDPDVQAQTT